MSIQTLPELDSSLYPQAWQQQTFDDPQTLLEAIITERVLLDPYAFTKLLQSNDVYQEWINTSIFGRYIQRSFAAIYNQSEDSFNMDVPVLFRKELTRHAQYLPLEQTLFVAGNIPKKVRNEKLFTTTLNPATAVMGAQKLKTLQLIINQIRIKSKHVLGFAIRHNKRTSERIRNEVLILGFEDLRLVGERSINNERIDQKISSTLMLGDIEVLLRCYELR